jgi:O-antigen/teichoic acid export membrane protein
MAPYPDPNDVSPRHDADATSEGSYEPIPDALGGPGAERPLTHYVARGAGYVFAGQVVRQVMSVATAAVLARLVAPSQFGLLAMVVAFGGLLGVFRDLGLSVATVQTRELTRQQLTNLFWVNVAVGTALSSILAALAPVLAAFYRYPELVPVAMAWGTVFLVASLGAQPNALLQRRMRFGALFVVDGASFATGNAAALYTAWLGWGVWALVVQELATNASRVVLPRREPGTRSLMAFGAYLQGFNAVNYFSRNLDNVLIGRVWGDAALGYYSRAYQLMLYPLGAVSVPLTRVMLPALSRLQTDHERLAAAYVRAVRVVTAITLPVTLLMAVCAEDAVIVVYGGQWTEAVPIFRVLCLAGFWQGLYNTIGWVYIPAGRTDRLFRWGLIGTPVICLGFVAGLPWGPTGVALGYVAAMSVLAYPFFWYAYRSISLPIGMVVRALWPALLAALASAVCTWLAQHFAVEMTDRRWLRLLLSASVGGVVYVLLLQALWPGPLREVRTLLASLLGRKMTGVPDEHDPKA